MDFFLGLPGQLLAKNISYVKNQKQDKHTILYILLFFKIFVGISALFLSHSRERQER